MESTAAEHQARPMTVKNSQARAPRVVLFGQLAGGQFVAKRLAEDEVPYTEAWPDAVAQVMVYIEPDDGQLEGMLAALRAGRLEFSKLQEFGGLDGGTSSIPA